MFAFFALAVLSEAGQRLFMAVPNVRYGQPVSADRAVASPQVVYYADAPVEEMYYANAAVPMNRAGPVIMSAVTERDADGNPVTHYEMIDPVYIGLIFVIFLAVLAKTHA
jgi:hypothetical protein